MPAFAPVNLNLDPSGTPQVLFEPVSIAGGLASFSGIFIDVVGGDPVLRVTSTANSPTMTISLQKPTKTSRISKARVKIVIPQPVMDGVVSTQTKDREASLDVTFMSSERALPVEREQLKQVLLQLLDDPIFTDVFVNNKSIY